MFVEIRKAGFVNKGAELMLRTIVSELRQRLPDAHLAVAASRRDTYARRAEMGLYQKIWFTRYGVHWGKLGRLLPKQFRDRFGMVVDEEIDVVLDASGFSYSDQWGPAKIREAAALTRAWKHRGKRVVYLPQAFGPFSTRDSRLAMETIVEFSDLVYARDRASHQHIQEIVGPRENVRLCPDLTIAAEPIVFESDHDLRSKVCIVPNHRMLDMTDASTREKYVPTLASVIDRLQSHSVGVFILVHEGQADLDLAEQLSSCCAQPVQIVLEPHALRIKAIIGHSLGLIGSRYHSLVSALSQGVPVLATGWSHKYEHLLDDFGVGDCMVSLTDSPQAIDAQVQRLLDDDYRRVTRSSLRDHADRFAGMIDKMWNEVSSIAIQRQ